MEPDIRIVTERLESLERENLRIKRSARLAKILSAATSALVIMVAAVPKVHSLGFPLPIAATEFDLLGPGGRITAKLFTFRNGPNLQFFDNKGKLVENVGVTNDSNGSGAGLSVEDGNAVLAGNGVQRVGVGITVTPTNAAGAGLATWDASGTVRSAVGQTLNGSIVYANTYDTNGNVRSGLDYDPAHDFTGFYSTAANGTNRSYMGQNTDDTDAFYGVKYADGIIAIQGFTPPVISGSDVPSVIVFDAAQAYRSVMGLEFFGTFDASENLTGHLP